MAVAAGSIVEHLDVVEDVGLREISGSVDLLPYSLLLDAAEERLSNGVVPAAAAAAAESVITRPRQTRLALY
jgi:hypothetical protein